MKKLINQPRAVVRDMLDGLAAQAQGVALLADETVLLRNPLPPRDRRQVAIISGGGSGHEPAHAGYVGEGMLTAAVAGDVFTSPSSDAVLAAIRAVSGPAGAVLIVKNYTGDRLNFGLAAEMARNEGIPVEVVVVADDVALHATVEKSRRRGIAGTVLVHKIAGAAAARGDDVARVATLARDAAGSLGSMGVALGSCTLPAVGKPGFELASDEIELGLGIHGEAGIERSHMRSSAELVDIMIEAITTDLGIAPKDQLALLVNGLGATPPMELAIVAHDALEQLRRRGLRVVRAWTGTFLSALDMPGCSLSLLKVDADRLALIDAPTDAPAWPRGGRVAENGSLVIGRPAPAAADIVAGGGGSPALRAAVVAAANALLAAEPVLTELDSKAGDGDLGASMARAAEAVLSLPDEVWSQDASQVLQTLGEALRRAIGGSSGPFYATALMRAGRRLAEGPDLDPNAIAEAFDLAVQSISILGGATPGDRTMLDALAPASAAFSTSIRAGEPVRRAVEKASQAADEGAAATATMKPKLGRASYLGERSLGIPDGGAKAVAIWMAAIQASLSQ